MRVRVRPLERRSGRRGLRAPPAPLELGSTSPTRRRGQRARPARGLPLLGQSLFYGFRLFCLDFVCLGFLIDFISVSGHDLVNFFCCLEVNSVFHNNSKKLSQYWKTDHSSRNEHPPTGSAAHQSLPTSLKYSQSSNQFVCHSFYSVKNEKQLFF